MVPTVRVVITFTKFVELPPVEQFYTPFSSPRQLANGEREDPSESHCSSLPSCSSSSSSSSSSTWLRRSSSHSAAGLTAKQSQRCSWSAAQDEVDPFAIPSGYTWARSDDKSSKLKRSKSTRKSK